MAKKQLKPGEIYEGPKAIMEVDGILAHYAIDDEGNPVARLVQVDLAPGNPDDGSEEYRIAAENDPVQGTPQSLVELEVENIQGSANAGV